MSQALYGENHVYTPEQVYDPDIIIERQEGETGQPATGPRYPKWPFTAGYQGRKASELVQAVKHFDAVVLDIRMSPRTRIPGWNDYQLAGMLPSRYFTCPAWGNVNYKSGGEIQIRDFEEGYKKFDLLWRDGYGQKRIILLCACADYDKCHRKVIAEYLLIDHGIHCAELAF